MILDHGAREMTDGNDIFYYITVMNENYDQPDLPPDKHEAVTKGMYSHARYQPVKAVLGSVNLLGSGAILREVIAAAELLATHWEVASTVWSVTSFSELARDARETERYNRLHPDALPRASHVASCLADLNPVIAATDYVVAYPQLISAYVRQPFRALGTDGFGRSDTRNALRRFFEVDRHHIVVTALHTLSECGSIAPSTVADAIAQYGIDQESPPPFLR